ncbi:hypothetical protein BDC45DRAFT_529859 [Circinella umbellata]|nr:hypothetical protein BDC45DRAFT_529859 [Circinella umbellata]
MNWLKEKCGEVLKLNVVTTIYNEKQKKIIHVKQKLKMIFHIVKNIYYPIVKNQEKSIYNNKIQKDIYKDKYYDILLEPLRSSNSKDASKRSLDELPIQQQKNDKFSKKQNQLDVYQHSFFLNRFEKFLLKLCKMLKVPLTIALKKEEWDILLQFSKASAMGDAKNILQDIPLISGPGFQKYLFFGHLKIQSGHLKNDTHNEGWYQINVYSDVFDLVFLGDDIYQTKCTECHAAAIKLLEKMKKIKKKKRESIEVLSAQFHGSKLIVYGLKMTKNGDFIHYQKCETVVPTIGIGEFSQAASFLLTVISLQVDNVLIGLNANSVIFDFSTNLPSKEAAYQTIMMQLGPIIGICTIGRFHNTQALLIEVRFRDEAAKLKAINDGILYHNHTYLAMPALAVDANITKVNFKELPFMEPELLHASLKNTMHHYGKVSQIRVYVDSATDLYEGEVTVILDITPPVDDMNNDANEPYYKPLTHEIYFDNWDAMYLALWKNACSSIMPLLQKRGL